MKTSLLRLLMNAFLIAFVCVVGGCGGDTGSAPETTTTVPGTSTSSVPVTTTSSTTVPVSTTSSIPTTVPGNYRISGQVTLFGNGVLPGVTVTLSGAGSAAVSTDAGGNYAFTGLGNGSYIITPSAAGFTFSPPNSSQTVTGQNITGVNFTTALYSISGQLTSDGTGLSSVTVTLSGAGSATVTTDANGNYTFSGLGNGSYFVTPDSGYIFSPSNSALTITGQNSTGVNFASTPNLPIYSLSGHVSVSVSGQDLSGVTMTLNGVGPGLPATVTTDAFGNFTFSGLNNGSYIISASKPGYDFGNNIGIINGQNITGVNFVAERAPSCGLVCDGIY